MKRPGISVHIQESTASVQASCPNLDETVSRLVLFKCQSSAVSTTRDQILQSSCIQCSFHLFIGTALIRFTDEITELSLSVYFLSISI